MGDPTIDAVTEEHIRTIRNHLYDGKAALFVGAGFSRNAQPRYAQTEHHFKTWSEVTEQLSIRLWGEEHRSSQVQTSRDPLWVAQRYEEEFGTEAFYNELRRAIPSDDYGPSGLHRELLSLDWRAILTTNLDTLLEDTLEELGKLHDVIRQDMDIPLGSNPLKLYKMHGCITQPSTIVFTEEQYRRYAQGHLLLAATVKALFAQYTVLFVGFSLTDPNFKVVYGWVRDVLSKYQRKAYAFLPAKEIEHHVRQYWLNRNVVLLPLNISSGTVDGYGQGLRPYLEYFDWSPTVEAETRDDEQRQRFVAKYQDAKDAHEVNFSEMQRDLVQLPRLPTNSPLNYYHSVALPDTFRRMLPAIMALEDRERYDILALWSELIPPETRIANTDLTDYLINLLRDHDDWGMSEARTRYLVQKSQRFIAQGLYRKAEVWLRDNSDEHSDSSQAFEIDRLWIRLLRAKFELDFPIMEELVKALERHHVPDDPKWFNRLGNVFRRLGDFPRAQDYFARAESSAKRRRDKWQLYVAYENLSRFWDYGLTHPQFEKERQKLAPKWSLSGHGQPNGGWGAERPEILDSPLGLVALIDEQGLPDDLLVGQEHDQFVDHLLADGRLDDAAWLAIASGHRAMIGRTVNPNPTINVRERLFELSLGLINTMTNWLDTVGSSRNLWFAQRCLVGAVTIWCEMAPSASIPQIETMGEMVSQLVDRVVKSTELRRHGGLPQELLVLCGVMMRVRPRSFDEHTIGRFIDELAPYINWRGIGLPSGRVSSPLSLTEDTIRTLVKSNAFGFLYTLLEAKGLDEATHRTILTMVYNDDSSDLAFETRFYLLHYFEDELDRSQAIAIVSAQIDRHAGRHWASDAEYVHQLGRVAGLISSDRREKLLSDLENKMQSDDSWQGRSELATAYMILVNELCHMKVLPNCDRLIDMFQGNKGRLTEAFARTFTDSWEVLPRDDVVAEINYGVSLMDPTVKRRYLYLAGRLLQRCATLTAGEESMVDAVVAGFHDSDGQVVRAALDAAKTFLAELYPWSHDYLAMIVEKTHPVAECQQVWVLTALASLYAVLQERQNDGIDLGERVSIVCKKLGDCSYAAVQAALPCDWQVQKLAGESPAPAN